MRIHTCLVCAALLFNTAHALSADSTVVIEAFYAWALKQRAAALPAVAERKSLDELIAPDLRELLDTAIQTQSSCIKAAQVGDKPFLLEGDPFVGNYEGVTEVAYGIPRRSADEMSVEVDMMYLDPQRRPGNKFRAVAWKDELRLSLLDGRWVVQDVRYISGQTLRSTLQAYADEGARECRLR